MSKIKCPCCQSYNIKPCIWLKEPDCFGCLDCDASWRESKRQPPALTPEAVWEWFCERFYQYQKDGCEARGGILHSMTCRVDVDDLDGAVYVDYDVTAPNGVNQKDELGPIFDADTIKVFGWQNMPPVSRKENRE